MKYLLLSEADEYFAARIGSDTWDSAEDLLKTKALNHAERNLSRLSYRGLAVNEGDIFPRDEQTEVPTQVKEAICEEALSLLDGVKNSEDLSNLHVTSSNVAGFGVTVNELFERPWIGLGLSSPIAWNLISPYLIDFNSFDVATA